MDFVSTVKDVFTNMLVLSVMIINVMFTNVKRDTQEFADTTETSKGVSSQLAVNSTKDVEKKLENMEIKPENQTKEIEENDAKITA